MNREPSHNMVRNLADMVRQELHKMIDYDVAHKIATELLSKAIERDDVYRVPTTRLAHLVEKYTSRHGNPHRVGQRQWEIERAAEMAGSHNTPRRLAGMIARSTRQPKVRAAAVARLRRRNPRGGIDWSRFPFYGTMSHGTLRLEDLLPDAMSLLDSVSEWVSLQEGADSPKWVSLYSRKDDVLGEIERNMEAADEEYYETEEEGFSEGASWDYDTVVGLLSEYAPPGFYFGSHPGDGSDIGYWPSEDQ